MLESRSSRIEESISDANRQEIIYAVTINSRIRLIQKSVRAYLLRTKCDRSRNSKCLIGDIQENYFSPKSSKIVSQLAFHCEMPASLTGFGIQLFEDGAKYIGNHINGKASGTGIFYHIEGDIYYGEFYLDKAEGYAINNYFNGSRYEGTWKNDLKHGIGIETWNDNSYFEGEYKDGKKCGIGKYKWSDGSIYSGEWQDNFIQGAGIYYFSDGRVYQGNWHQNSMDGIGLMKFDESKFYLGKQLLLKLGNFEKDIKEGFGILLWRTSPNNCDIKIYLGFWKKGLQNGIGKFYSNKGTRFGYWVEGERVMWYKCENDCVSNIDDSDAKYRSFFKLSIKEVVNLLELFNIKQ